MAGFEAAFRPGSVSAIYRLSPTQAESNCSAGLQTGCRVDLQVHAAYYRATEKTRIRWSLVSGMTSQVAENLHSSQVLYQGMTGRSGLVGQGFSPDGQKRHHFVKGTGFSPYISAPKQPGLQPLREYAVKLTHHSQRSGIAERQYQ